MRLMRDAFEGNAFDSQARFFRRAVTSRFGCAQDRFAPAVILRRTIWLSSDLDKSEVRPAELRICRARFMTLGQFEKSLTRLFKENGNLCASRFIWKPQRCAYWAALISIQIQCGLKTSNPESCGNCCGEWRQSRLQCGRKLLVIRVERAKDLDTDFRNSTTDRKDSAGSSDPERVKQDRPVS